MKPAPFDYSSPASVEEALSILNERGSEAKILAGGQSLIPVMNFRLAQPSYLVDLNRLSALDFVQHTEAGGVRIGAMTRQRTLERSGVLAQAAPLLAGAMPFVAHPQIRNRGTLGGSLAHADPAAELPAVAVALDARFKLARHGSSRWVAAKDFFQGLFFTSLEPEEMLAEVELPPWSKDAGWSFLEVARRHGDYAQVGVAARVSLSAERRYTDCRLVFLSVGDIPIAADEAAAALRGETPSEELFRGIADQVARNEIDPSGDIHASADYKRHLAGVLVKRALGEATARALGRRV